MTTSISPGRAAELAAQAGPEQVVRRWAASLDAQDWDGVRGLLAPLIWLDYRDLTGQPAGEVAAGQVVAGWRSSLAPGEYSRHELTDARTEPAAGLRTAQVVVRVLSRRWRSSSPGEDQLVRTLSGRYLIRLGRDTVGAWRISDLVLRTRD